MEDRNKRLRLVERVIELRAVRRHHLPPELLGEPGWDILLELYAAELAQQPMAASGFKVTVPPTTLERWLQTLEAAGLVTTHRPAIGTGSLCELTERGTLALDGLFKNLSADLIVR